MFTRNFYPLICSFLLFILECSGVLASERILHFDSKIELIDTDSLLVTETIKVQAEGQQIKRGIYRDIPLNAEDANGRIFQPGFKLLSVKFEGSPAPHFTRTSSDGIRIYVGEEDVFLRRGTYTYVFQYEMNRQVRLFPSHDEIYWNVTGNEWAFPIDSVTAQVHLPDGVVASDWIAYTGRYGEEGNAYKAQARETGSGVYFSVARTLPAGGGLTVSVSMPAGSVKPPSEEEQFRYFLIDYRSELIGAGGFLIVLVYYVLAWLKVGRDPQKGVIFPRFKAPQNISPALAYYVAERGFRDGGWIALSSACISLAMKKLIRFKDVDGQVVLEMRDNFRSNNKLPVGEAAVYSWLNRRGSPITLNKSNGESISSLGKAFRKAIHKESKDVFFKTNRGYTVFGAVISLLTIVLLLAFGQMRQDQIEIVLLFLVLLCFASFTCVNIGKAAIQVQSMEPRMALIFGLFGCAVAAAMFGAYHITGSATAVPTPALIAAVLGALNLLFYFLIGAPTALGRQTLDEVEGLKMYLSVAEADRLNMAAVPDMNTEHFEELLPYAVALGVEKPWATAFEGWLKTAAISASTYAPSWYADQHFGASNLASNVSRTASEMSSTFKSSLPAPKSSSSGSSGGFSGGGGGGGGGGGW